jgi:hypothetical protein
MPVKELSITINKQIAQYIIISRKAFEVFTIAACSEEEIQDGRPESR